jgi:hypothetical protein
MAKERGFAVVSGSSTVVARIMENGTVIFGQDMAATGSYSGTLVLNLPSGAGDGRVLQVDASNSASLGALSASFVTVSSIPNLTSSNVQSALAELQADIDAISGSSNLDVSDGDTFDSITFSSERLEITGTANEVDVNFTKTGATGSFQVGLPSDVTVTNSLTANTLTASNGLLVNAGGATVTGNISGSGNLQAGGTLTVAGNTTLNGGTNTVNGNLQVNGNLIVTGSTVTLDVQNLRVEDPIIVLGSGSGALVDGDRGFVMTQSGSANLGFGWDDAAQRFKLGTTAQDGTTQTLGITSSLTLEVGDLITTGSVTVGNGLTVTGTVNLPANSIGNSELEFSSIELTLGTGISGSVTTISLGGTGSVVLDLAELPTVTVDVANDSLAIVDASSGSGEQSRLVTIAGLATGMAGTGLTATNGVLDVDYGSTAGTAVQGNTVLTVSGTTNEIEIDGGLFTPITLGTPTTITIGLPDNVSVSGNLTVGGNLIVSGNTTLGTGTDDTITMVGNLRNPVFSVAGANAVAGFPTVPDAYITNSASFGGYSFYLTSSAASAGNGITPGSGSWGQANKWYFNENGEWYASFFIGV